MKTRSQNKELKLDKLNSKEKQTTNGDITKKKSNTKQKGQSARKNKVSKSQQPKEDAIFGSKMTKLTSKESKKTLSKPKIEETKDYKDVKIDPKDYGKPKNFTKHDTKVAKLTEWIDISIKELHSIMQEERKQHKDIDEEEICPICRCELYDDLFQLSEADIDKEQQKQVEDPSRIEVVKFKDCLDHFYHKGCTEGMLAGKEYIK